MPVAMIDRAFHDTLDPVGSAKTMHPDTRSPFCTELILPSAVATAMIDHLMACLPLEGVGLVSVTDDSQGWIADRYYAGRNLDASPTRFTMDPADVSTAVADMGRRKARLGAVAHSHPRTPPVPSRHDLAEATLPGALCLIVAFMPTVSLRGWQLTFNDVGVAVGAGEITLRIVTDATC